MTEDSRTRPMPVRLFAALAALLLILAACTSDGDQATDTPGEETPAATASTGTGGPSPTGDGGGGGGTAISTPLPNAEGELIPVRMAQSVNALSFAPLLIALELNFFGYQGVDLEYIELESGATARQALIGGSVDLVDSASTEVMAAVAEGVEYLTIQGTINQTLQLCVERSFMEGKGVTPESSLEERIAALDGATIGITGPGAVSDRAMRWLLIEYGGLDPDNDTVITQIGGPPTLAAALDAGQIQAFLISPPACASAANGVVLVEPGDVPEFVNYIHEVLFGMREWIEANPDAATRVATAISMGNNYIIEHPEEALRVLQEGPFVDTDPAIVETAFYETILPQVEALPSGLMSQEQWEETNTVLLEAGVIESPVDVAEGGFWTNEYIDEEGAQLP
jgi:NitT/TauT family transport system substrate-binding protein